jgi:integrase/recombinase XerD
MKLSDAIDGYFLDRSLELAETTIANYRHYFTLFQEFMGDKDIETVTAKDITKFLTHLSRKRGLSDRTVYDVRVRLSTLWTWASAELEIPNVITGVAKPKYTEPEIIPYTRHELHQLVQAAEYNASWRTRTGKVTRSKRATALRDKAIVLTLVDSGIRASELCNLNVGDFDDQTGRLHIRHGKGDKARFTIVGKRTQKAIWRYVSSRAEPKSTDPLFVSGNDGRLHRGNLYRMIRQWGDRVGIERANVHRFRHTFAITFLRNGGGVFELQALLGHEELHTVTTYVKLAQQDIDAAQRHSPADNWRL